VGAGNGTGPMLGDFRSIVEPLAKMLGPQGEVVLHSFEDLDHSIIEISGNVTGRPRGGPITNLVLSRIRAQRFENVINYENRLEDGRILKSSTIFVRDAEGNPVGCLCINMDVSGLELAMSVLKGLCNRNPAVPVEEPSERFSSDVYDMARTMLAASLNGIGKPVAFMQKDDKVQVVGHLDSQGFFLIKGSVELAAKGLGTSRYTIYNYLDEVRGTHTIQKTEREGSDAPGE